MASKHHSNILPFLHIDWERALDVDPKTKGCSIDEDACSTSPTVADEICPDVIPPSTVIGRLGSILA